MGCERTYDEISMWETYGDEQRQKVLDRISAANERKKFEALRRQHGHHV
jgi:predicted Fe-S protein YdhL (DUF1289 family)